ncbi:MurR/RpiR family transcriptional regulator [Devosia faecipullorum]|uniref:MurR/RpiR family transcriptional regulator n=1 Tax=Devosia faecipullorum TaxID=2755039 RepID=UPI00187B24DA|nr:MurR/RpiR family transcriptional regulator [Devosia faecipullorum]MBE7732561.1 MurR/RpiR family transcriptional regulator [Devosia faecipullorum]
MEGKTVASRIHDLHGELTGAGRKVARGLLGNYPLLGLAPVAEFASGADVSAATVVRFVAQLGFKSYPDFQRALREELEERSKSPLERPALLPVPEGEDSFLAGFLNQAAQRISATLHLIPDWEFESVCQKLAEGKGHCYLAGGRFTDYLAGYLEAHLRLVRPAISRLDGRMATRADQMIDVRPGDLAILFDVRRYDDALLLTAAELARKRAHIVLITDEWLSPVARHARHVLPCQTETGRTWDANGAVLALVEAMIARTTELAWPSASKRIGALEGQALRTIETRE